MIHNFYIWIPFAYNQIEKHEILYIRPTSIIDPCSFDIGATEPFRHRWRINNVYPSSIYPLLSIKLVRDWNLEGRQSSFGKPKSISGNDKLILEGNKNNI